MTSPEVAARDAEIFAAADELEAETGRRPTRKALADWIRRTTGHSCSAGRVSQAYTRRRQAEAEATGKAPERERAPGAGRKGAPLVEVVTDLCEKALAAAAELSQGEHRALLPRAYYGAARRLRGRRGWRKALREMAAGPAPAPEAEQLEIDVVAILEQQVVQLTAVIASHERPADARQDRETLLRCLEKLERLRPADERDGRVTVDQADMDRYVADVTTRLKNVIARRQAEKADRDRAKVEELRAAGKLTAEVREALRLFGHLPKETPEP
jgi:hypothetical protein